MTEADPVVEIEQNEQDYKPSCCQKLKSCLTLSPEGATPVNYKVMSLCVLALFSSSFTITFLFPFLPEMILTFGYKEEEKGYYAGIVASAMFAGRAFGSYFWGWLSDRKGRRPIIILTVLGNGIFALAFGFTRNLTQAIVFRFITGLCNGSVGTAKTILYEISDDTNQAVGMSALALAWGGGIIIGPAIGGYLASPAKKYPHLFQDSVFLQSFPYILPSIVAFIIAIIAVVVLFWKLPETLVSRNLQTEINPNDEEEEEKMLESPTSVKVENSKTENRIPQRHTDFARFLSLESLNCDTRLAPYLQNVPESKGDKSAKNNLEDSVNLVKSCTALVEVNDNTVHMVPVTNCHRRLSRSENALNLSKFTGPKLPLAVNGQTKNGHILQDKADSSEKHENNEGILMEKNQKMINSENSESFRPDNGCLHDNGNHINGCLHDDKDISKNSPRCTIRIWRAIKNSAFVTLLKDPDVRHAVFLYTIFSFAAIGHEEVFTVWASTEPLFDGLGFDTDALGTVIGAASIPLFCLQIFIFPALAKGLGLNRTFLLCGMVVMIAVLGLPMLHLIYDKEIWLWVALLFAQMPMKIAVTCAFACSSLFINNSVSPQTAGAVNGIAMTFTALARTLAPTIGGSVFAWSISYGSIYIGPPFDVNFAFLLFSLVYWFSALYCVIFIPSRLNTQSKK